MLVWILVKNKEYKDGWVEEQKEKKELESINRPPKDGECENNKRSTLSTAQRESRMNEQQRSTVTIRWDLVSRYELNFCGKYVDSYLVI